MFKANTLVVVQFGKEREVRTTEVKMFIIRSTENFGSFEC